ncbi:MAG: transporter related protein [Gaiellaceae bacterium]|nr:transporter related protein [Gaiellaceae bacterium]
MRVQLAGVGKHHGAQAILDQVTLTIGEGARVGLVGPNGVGKTTLLRIVVGHELPDTGTVVRAPERAAIGYLAQERVSERGVSILAWLSRQAGIDHAERELEESAHALADGHAAGDRYAAALDRLVALGARSFTARARTTCAELGLGFDLDRALVGLSGGEASRVALAAILLSRFDLLLLDEPTNDLDFDGLDRLERFLGSYRGALVVVSHDREFLDRTVDRIASIEADTHRVREWTGGFSEYEAARDTERAAALADYEQGQLRRKELTRLLSTRRTEARGKGASLGDKTGGQDRRATHALQTKVRQAERLLERNELPPKPFEPWELELTLPSERPSDVVLQLADAVAERGTFRFGPVDLDLAPRERLSIVGPNGAGKSTLLRLVLDGAGLVGGRRVVGRRTVIGAIGQERDAYSGGAPLVDELMTRSGLARVEARTLLAKFGLRAEHIGRACASLSPGERTRAHLAELQARGVNLLVLDEPTNHLDLEAVEQLESALVDYEGTLVVVSHDRRFLERIAPTKELPLPL